jgi:FkbM family methyltransferase
MDLHRIANFFTPKTVLDIGAHTGEFYELIRNVFPESYVFSIEGNQGCEPYLQRLGHPYLIRYLGREQKKTILYKTVADKLCTGDSLYREVTDHYSGQQLIEQEVALRTIDDTFKEETMFDLIKLDTQGSELDILAGGPKVAKKAKGILMEVSYIKYNEGAPLYDDVIKFMTEFGFTEKDILNETKWSRDGLDHLQRDLLFINNNLL